MSLKCEPSSVPLHISVWCVVCGVWCVVCGVVGEWRVVGGVVCDVLVEGDGGGATSPAQLRHGPAQALTPNPTPLTSSSSFLLSSDTTIYEP